MLDILVWVPVLRLRFLTTMRKQQIATYIIIQSQKSIIHAIMDAYEISINLQWIPEVAEK